MSRNQTCPIKEIAPKKACASKKNMYTFTLGLHTKNSKLYYIQKLKHDQERFYWLCCKKSSNFLSCVSRFFHFYKLLSKEILPIYFSSSRKGAEILWGIKRGLAKVCTFWSLISVGPHKRPQLPFMEGEHRGCNLRLHIQSCPEKSAFLLFYSKWLQWDIVDLQVEW